MAINSCSENLRQAVTLITFKIFSMELNRRVFGFYENKLIRLNITSLIKCHFTLGNASLINKAAATEKQIS